MIPLPRLWTEEEWRDYLFRSHLKGALARAKVNLIGAELDP